MSAHPAPCYLLSFHHHGKSLWLPQRNTFLPCILALVTPVLSLRRSCWLVFAFAKCCLPLPALERLKNSGTFCLSYSCALQTERMGGRFPLKAFLLPKLFLRHFRKEMGRCERASFLWPASQVKWQHMNFTEPRAEEKVACYTSVVRQRRLRYHHKSYSRSQRAQHSFFQL